MNELNLNYFDFKVLNNFHRVCKQRQKESNTDITQFRYHKNSTRIVFGDYWYNTLSIISTYDTDFRFDKDLTIDCHPFLFLVNNEKILPKLTYLKKTDRLVLKIRNQVTNIKDNANKKEYDVPYEKLIPNFKKMKKDFSFKLDADFFRTLTKEKLKLRHHFAFDFCSFISIDNNLTFRLGNHIDFKKGGLKSSQFDTKIKTKTRFAVRLNRDQIKYLTLFFVSDYEVTSYEKRKYLVFRNVYKPITYILFIHKYRKALLSNPEEIPTPINVDPKPTTDSNKTKENTNVQD